MNFNNTNVTNLTSETAITTARATESDLHILSTQEQEQEQQQSFENPTRKKKCRGNRKKQRYRRQLYLKGLETDAVEKLVQEKFDNRTDELPEGDQSGISTEYRTEELEVYIPLNRVRVTFVPDDNLIAPFDRPQ